MSNWTKDAVLESLKGVVEPELGKDIVSLDLVELSGPLEGQSSTGQGITVQVKSSNPAMHARKRMQDAVEFALERGMGTPVECEVEVIPLQKEERTLETRKVLPGNAAHCDSALSMALSERAEFATRTRLLGGRSRTHLRLEHGSLIDDVLRGAAMLSSTN